VIDKVGVDDDGEKVSGCRIAGRRVSDWRPERWKEHALFGDVRFCVDSMQILSCSA
jgi:hypothetical protein